MSDQITQYKPIDCALHDQLEVLALRKSPIDIVYFENNKNNLISGGVIETTLTKDAVEYLKLVSGETIRLDYLLVVDGVTFK